jgi:hypothetical protein
VCSRIVVIGHIRKEEVTQVSFAEDDDMVKTFPPDRANQPFRMAILPWRLGRGWPVAKALRPNAMPRLSLLKLE